MNTTNSSVRALDSHYKESPNFTAMYADAKRSTKQKPTAKARKPFKQVINLFNDENRFMYTPTPCLCIPLDAASVEALRVRLGIGFYAAGFPVNSDHLSDTVLRALGIPQKKAKK